MTDKTAAEIYSICNTFIQSCAEDKVAYKLKQAEARGFEQGLHEGFKRCREMALEILFDIDKEIEEMVPAKGPSHASAVTRGWEECHCKIKAKIKALQPEEKTDADS